MKGLSEAAAWSLDSEGDELALLALSREKTVTFACARCHHQFSADEAPEVCPKCGAEAGLEVQKGVPVPMKLFGMLVVGVLVAAFAGGLASYVGG